MATKTQIPDSQSRAFATEIAQLRSDVDALKRSLRAAQLGKSTIDNGRLDFTDETGTIRGSLGMNADGSFSQVSSNAPPPPQPSTPQVAAIASGASITWDGVFASGASKPLDFSYIEVHVGGADNFTPSPTTLSGTLSEAGTWIAAPLDTGGTYYVGFIAVNTSAKKSPMSTLTSVQPLQVVAQQILDGIVTEVKLANNAVTQGKIALQAVGQGQIAGEAVGTGQLASGAVSAAKLLDGAVVSGKIAADAVGATEIAANSIVAGKIAADAVTTATIAANAVNADKIAAASIAADKIAANAVTAEKIAALAVTADKLAANSINAGHITAGAVTAGKLAATLLLSSTIIAGTTTTGARVQLNSGGIEAFRANGTRVMNFDTATGDITIAGRYRSQDSGTRIEINPGGTAPDQIRFYQNSSDYGYLNAENAPGGTAAIIARAQSGSSSRGSFGCYPTESFIATTNSSGTTSRCAVSCLADSMNQWAGRLNLEGRAQYGDGIVSFNYRNSSGNYQSNRLLEYKGAGSGEPALYAPAHGVQVVWSGGTIYIQDANGLNRPIVASNVAAPSSRAIKKLEAAISLFRGTGRAAIASVESKQWLYEHEYGPGETPPVPEPYKIRNPKRTPAGRAEVDVETGEVIYEEEVIIPPTPEPTKPHFFPIAEDLAIHIPELVREDTAVQGGLIVDLRDVVGFLWQVSREQEFEIRTLRQKIVALEGRP